jgi:hypothetical protein
MDLRDRLIDLYTDPIMANLAWKIKAEYRGILGLDPGHKKLEALINTYEKIREERRGNK